MKLFSLFLESFKVIQNHSELFSKEWMLHAMFSILQINIHILIVIFMNQDHHLADFQPWYYSNRHLGNICTYRNESRPFNGPQLSLKWIKWKQKKIYMLTSTKVQKSDFLHKFDARMAIFFISKNNFWNKNLMLYPLKSVGVIYSLHKRFVT